MYIALFLVLCVTPAKGQIDARTVTWRAHPPGSYGFDTIALADAVHEASTLAPPLTSLLVARGTTTVAEVYFGAGGPNRAANLKSASKSILSGLVGIAIDEGALAGLNKPIGPFFPVLLDNAPRKRRITVSHLLTQQTGLETTSFGNYGTWVSSRDWVASALRQPFVDRPGGEMIYSTGNTHILGAIVAKATGQPLRAYAQDRLFDPLGVRIRSWQRAPKGRYFGGNNLALTPRALLRFGQLYLNEGRFEGQRLIPADWIDLSWRTYVRETYHGHQYGFLWFRDTFAGEQVAFAWGYGGQYLFVVPRLHLVVACTSSLATRPPRSTDHNEEILRLLADEIIPAARSPYGIDAWPRLPRPWFGW